jgi:dihydroorotate dehydrogenase (fumarate)
MLDLTATYLGHTLVSPVVASASPLSGKLDVVRRLEAAGVGAIVMHSLFERNARIRVWSWIAISTSARRATTRA